MFSPRKHRNIRKKSIDEEDVSSPSLSAGGIPSSPATPLTSPTAPITSTPKSVKKIKKPAAVLSFADDEDGMDNPKLKKTPTHGRKLGISPRLGLDLLDAPSSRATVASSTSYSKESMDELKKLAKSLPSRPVVDPSGSTSLVEDKFPTLLKGPTGSTTVIPDAAAIHLAKKKREQMRLRNDTQEEEFISLIAAGEDHELREEREKDTRLVREEDDEVDDGEEELERVIGEKLALGSKAERLARKNKKAAQRLMMEERDDEEDEEDQEETREWELQQIRNAGIQGAKKPNTLRNSAPVHRTVAIPAISTLPGLGDVRHRLAQQLEALKSTQQNHNQQLDQIRRDVASLEISAVDAHTQMEKSSLRYTYFQELKSYCWSLAGFFEEKFPALEGIEDQFTTLLAQRTKVVMDRRLQDQKCDLALFGVLVEDPAEKDMYSEVDEFGRSLKIDPAEERQRFMADRVRRRQARKRVAAESSNGGDESNNSNNTYDGYSTDDDLGAGDDREFLEAILELQEKQNDIFADVNNDFKSIEVAKGHFQTWKTDYFEDYSKAYGGLILPSVFDFYVRKESCLWNPFRVHQEFSDQEWHRVISSYKVHHHLDNSEDEDEGKELPEEDMDATLINKVVAKSLIPKISQLLKAGALDLYSGNQNKLTRQLFEQLQDYVDKKDRKMEQLLAHLQTLLQQVSEQHRAQFLMAACPLTPRHILTNEGIEARERYLWRTISLFRNLMSWKRIVPSAVLEKYVIQGLFRDCLLRLLEGEETDAVVKYQMIYEVLPEHIRAQERHLFVDRLAKV